MDKINGAQCVFRRTKSTTDLIFCMRQILEKKWEYNVTARQLFIDFENAYDSEEKYYTIISLNVYIYEINQ